jgi:transcriptional regulator with XRE-family HTH domain
MLGDRIRHYRLSKGLSMKYVTDKAKITRSLLSQIENNKANPSINSLTAIAHAIGTPIAQFFDETNGHDENPVVKAKERKVLRAESGITCFLLTPRHGKHKIEVLYNVFEKNGSTESPYKNAGEECGIVLEGRLNVSYSDEEYILNRGDSITIDSSRPYKLTNVHPGRTIGIWIRTLPTW